MEQQKWDADDRHSFGDVGHRVGEGRYQLQEGEGQDVLQPVKDPVHNQEKQNVDCQLITLLAVPETGGQDVAQVVEQPQWKEHDPG